MRERILVEQLLRAQVRERNRMQRATARAQVRHDGHLARVALGVAEGALRGVIRYYTREAGVRSLEREISKICRKVVKGVQLKKYTEKVVVTEENLNDFLGVQVMVAARRGARRARHAALP